MTSQPQTLASLAKVIRSKNAGPFELTFDIMFDNVTAYERVKKSGVINAARIAEAYRVRVDDVLVCRPYDAAVAFKITLRRPVGSADAARSACDVLASQSSYTRRRENLSELRAIHSFQSMKSDLVPL